MRLDELPRSDNVEDRRGMRVPGGRSGLGIGPVVLLRLLGWWLGIDPSILIGGAEILTGGGSSQQQTQLQAPTGAPSDQTGQFVAAVLGSTEAQWKAIFEQNGQTYEPPTLVMFSGATRSACGFAQAAMGPFYCPNDREVYLDTSFFNDLERRFRGCSGKACQFAQAYVIAHEVGHHVQNQLGILPKVQQAQRTSGDRVQSNQLQVQVELQADCFAGVWAKNAEAQYKFIEPGDIDAALQTASAIGDDTLQRRTQGTVVPESFTHGSAEQRKRWFMTGFKEGTVKACNTFGSARL